jgi:hypothetical protein
MFNPNFQRLRLVTGTFNAELTGVLFTLTIRALRYVPGSASDIYHLNVAHGCGRSEVMAQNVNGRPVNDVELKAAWSDLMGDVFKYGAIASTLNHHQVNAAVLAKVFNHLHVAGVFIAQGRNCDAADALKDASLSLG